MTDYQALREAAEKATPEQYVMGSTPQDARYLAAASPDVILGLLDKIERDRMAFLLGLPGVSLGIGRERK